MIENSKKLVFRLVTLVALAAAGCSVSASGEIPCVDDSSCPSDYPVCTAGKCVAGTSTSAATVAIVGVQGHAASDILSGSITIAVTARATSGVSSVTLAAGSKTYQADKTSAPPIYYFIVPTTDLSNADVSVTATVTAGDGTTASSPGFTIHVDNAAPTLTITLIGSADVADGSMAKFDVSANEALASITGTVSGTGSGPLSEISPASGNVHHFGYAVTAADAAGLHNVSFTAVDLAGNSTPASMSNAFNVHHPFAFASLTVSTGLSQVAGFPAAKTGTLVTISATLPSSVAFAASATPVFKLTSANSGPTRTLTPTKTASPPNDTWTATYTVVSGDHDGLALVTADATDIAANVAPTRSATLNIGQTAPVISSINVTPANSDTVHNSVTLTGVASEPLQSVTVVSNNGSDSGTCKCDGNSDCSADTSLHPVVACQVTVSSGATSGTVAATAKIKPVDLFTNTSNDNANYNVVPLPVGVSLTPAASSITAGLTTTIAAHFTGGTALVVGTDGSSQQVADLGSVTVSPPLGDTTYHLQVTNAATTQDQTINTTVHVVAPPSLTSFTALPTVISAGGSTTLTGVFGAGTASIDHGVGAVTSGVGVLVSPTTTTTYTLTVTNAAGTQVQSTATVTVGAIPALSFNASTNSIFPGGSSTLTSNVSSAVSATIDPGAIPIAPDGVNHDTPVSPSVTTTYTLTAVNGAGLASRLTQTVTVTPAAITSFLATAGTVNAGGTPQLTPIFGPVGSTASITLSTDNTAHPCGTTITSGTPVNCSAINADTTYVLTVTAGTSTDTSQASVKATPASITSFISAGNVNAGGTPKLTPTFGPAAATATIVDGTGAAACGGSITSGAQATCAAINEDTTYLLTVTLGGTTATKTVTVTATRASATSLTPNASTVNAGTAPKLTPVFGPSTATVAISDGTGTPCGSSFTSGNQVTCSVINATTVYTMTVTQGGTIATATATVTVTPATATSLTPQSALVNSGTAPKLTPVFGPSTATVAISDGTGTPCGSSFTSGNQVTCSAITSNTVYTMTVTQGSTVATFSTTVKVNPFFSSFTAVAPTLGSAGGTPKLIPVFGPANATGAITFTSGGAPACGGTVTSGSQATCSAIATTTSYTLTVNANGGTPATTTVTVTVADNPATGLNLAAPASVVKQSSTTSASFSLTPNFCATCTATLFDGSTLTSGLTSGNAISGKTITATTTFTLTATNAAGESASTDATVTLLPGSFAATAGAPAQGRFGGTATLLPNGTVLITGGRTTEATASTSQSDAEIYNPATNQFRPLSPSTTGCPGACVATGNMQDARYQAAAVLLPTGLVLISGGIKGNGSAVNTQDWFDPALDGFRTTTPGNLDTARAGHTATLLSDGTVFLYGGSSDGTNANAIPNGELYTDGSAANTLITSFGTAPLARYRHTATVLGDGSVLLAGGILAGGTTPTKLDIISKTGAATFANTPPVTGTMAVARSGGHAAIKLPDSRILLIGGTAGTTPFAEIGTISGAGGTASLAATTGAMSTARCNVGATLLSTGNVLVVGGNNCSTATALQSAEVFNAATGSFQSTMSPTAARQEMGAAFLFNGLVLIEGGNGTASSELYNPN